MILFNIQSEITFNRADFLFYQYQGEARKFGKITIYGQMEIKFQFGIGRPFPNANIQVWKWNSISKNYNIIT